MVPIIGDRNILRDAACGNLVVANDFAVESVNDNGGVMLFTIFCITPHLYGFPGVGLQE